MVPPSIQKNSFREQYVVCLSKSVLRNKGPLSSYHFHHECGQPVGPGSLPTWLVQTTTNRTTGSLISLFFSVLIWNICSRINILLTFQNAHRWQVRHRHERRQRRPGARQDRRRLLCQIQLVISFLLNPDSLTISQCDHDLALWNGQKSNFCWIENLALNPHLRPGNGRDPTCWDILQREWLPPLEPRISNVSRCETRSWNLPGLKHGFGNKSI